MLGYSGEIEMSKWHKKQEMRDPEMRIGTTPEGQPIFMDLRELIASPSENEERMQLTVEQRIRNKIEKAALMVIENAGRFVEQTFLNITPNSVCNADDPRELTDYAKRTGFQAIQDGLKTVCKSGGKVIREMNAKVPKGFEEQIANRVDALVREIKA